MSRDILLEEDENLLLQWIQSDQVKSKESWTAYFYFGLGSEEIGAFAAARELHRHGGKELYQKTIHWLETKQRRTRDPEMDGMMNRNAFFNRFFATGKTIDTEEVVCLTSRSPRYYVSGAYWDRDTLLWSFPSILTQDLDWAKEVLTYVFNRQGKNFGVHSRYLSGAILEQGFELDEFCAPIMALRNYLEHTRDIHFLERSGVRESFINFEKGLAEIRHPKKRSVPNLASSFG